MRGDSMSVPCRLLSGAFVVALCCAGLWADEKDKKPAHGAVTPTPRKDKWWMGRHKAFLERVKKGKVEVVFLGDSITQGWEGNGKKVWAREFAPLGAVNLGIGGDETGHVLWRITEGKELEGTSPRAAVLMIGTNNLRAHTDEQIAEGVTAIVKELRRQKPDMQVLLLGIFPRGARATNPDRARIKDINKRLARLADGKKVRYLDIGPRFLEEDGS